VSRITLFNGPIFIKTSRNIRQIHQNWSAFVVEFPSLFNEIFKKCAKLFEKEAFLDSIREVPLVDDTPILSQSDVGRDFAALFQDMPFSDVELEVDGKILKAHKCILTSKCSVRIS
jgi:hypothetical protein